MILEGIMISGLASYITYVNQQRKRHLKRLRLYYRDCQDQLPLGLSHDAKATDVQLKLLINRFRNEIIYAMNQSKIPGDKYIISKYCKIESQKEKDQFKVIMNVSGLDLPESKITHNFTFMIDKKSFEDSKQLIEARPTKKLSDLVLSDIPKWSL